MNGSSEPAGLQSAPHALFAHDGVLAWHPRIFPDATHLPDTLQLKGSSEPAGVQSAPHALFAHLRERFFSALSAVPSSDSAPCTDSVGGHGVEEGPAEQPAATAVMSVVQTSVVAKVQELMPRTCRLRPRPICTSERGADRPSVARAF